ncbi:MAG: hypothetical protein NVS3B7_01960 [Candidatus Elarobacter sp.]
MIAEPTPLPKVSLSRPEWIRMAIVGILVVISLAGVVPDLVRIAYPLHVFGYVTDGDGKVISTTVLRPLPPLKLPFKRGGTPAGAGRHGHKRVAPAAPSTVPGERLQTGDIVRIDRILPFDRKPGIAGTGYTYDNPDRFLPISRAGEERVVHLIARDESVRSRFLDILRVVLFVAAIAIGAILFLVKPGIATAAFFVFCLAGVEAPSTFIGTFVPNPWRPIPELLSDALRGAVRPALLLFALCLIDGDADAPRERLFAWIAAAMAVILGTLNADAQWRLNFAALPGEQLNHMVKAAEYAVSAMTVVAFAIAFVRAHHNDRHRIGWIVAAFLFAGAARLASDAFYPARIPFWINSILVSMTIVPIVAIGIAVVRHRFFNVDFVVSRAVVYVALSLAVIGTIAVAEEVGGYIFYNSGTDIAYLVLSAVLYGVGLFTFKIRQLLDHAVDRFIFRDRQEQREALEFIAGYILDAETIEDVYRALLQDAAHALKLAFGGILARKPDGSYELAESYAWPENLVVRLAPDDELTRAITRSRGALTFTGKDTRLIQRSFPNERLAFAAPLFYDRIVSGIVVYGHNVSGLDLDPEEREHLVRVVSHASIALNAIELARYRGSAPSAPPAPLPSSDPLVADA